MTRVVQRVQIVGDSASIRTSAGAFKVLTVNELHSIPTVWYETLEKPVIPIEVTFTIVPTGGAVPDHAVYVGTALINGKASHIYQYPDV